MQFRLLYCVLFQDALITNIPFGWVCLLPTQFSYSGLNLGASHKNGDLEYFSFCQFDFPASGTCPVYGHGIKFNSFGYLLAVNVIRNASRDDNPIT